MSEIANAISEHDQEHAQPFRAAVLDRLKTNKEVIQMEKKIGHYSFIIGVILAVILGLFTKQLGDDIIPVLISILVVLGLIVGFLNVTGKETTEFLTVATILVIVSYAGGATGSLGNVWRIGPYLTGIFQAIMALVVPAAVVVGLKDVWRLGQNR